jgi:hypothetical protein
LHRKEKFMAGDKLVKFFLHRIYVCSYNERINAQASKRYDVRRVLAHVRTSYVLDM